MTKEELENRIRELRRAYWEGECTTPDCEYDGLVEQLRSIDPSNPLLTTPEHGASHGYKVQHSTPMLSLQKVYNKDDLMKWIATVSRSDEEEFLVQPKYDGISCHFFKGIYATRGDGNVGEDVSCPCSAMCEKDLGEGTDPFDFYGEIVIKKSVFDTVYKNVRRDGGELFKNSRNAVAGILNCDNYDCYQRQGATMTLVDYGKYSFRMKKSEADTKWDIIKGVINSLDYPMDGIVVKIADRDWYDAQGATSHHPKGAMAFKFENSSAKTFLQNVEWGMGKEYITATAVFQPVQLGGVTVTRAYIPMKSKTLPSVMNGDFNHSAILTVERAGDVIPHVTAVSKAPVGAVFAIDSCPFCGSAIAVGESWVKCTNDYCEQKQIHRLYEALSILGVKNIGETTVSEVCRGLNPDRISLRWWMSKIPSMTDEIASLPGFGAISAGAIVDETNRVLDEATLAQVIAAQGIPNLGIKIARELEKKYGTASRLFNNATEQDLVGIPGVGEVMAKRIMEWLDDFKKANDFLETAKLFRFSQNPPAQVQSQPAVVGNTVCFTGKMRMKRNEMMFIARSHGYAPVDDVVKGLDLLVVADGVDLTSGKCVKAQKYGTRIMRESDFLQLCNSALKI